MKECVPTQGEWVILKDDAARGLGLLQLVERRKTAMSNGFIGERPQPFAGLQLRAVRAGETGGGYPLEQ